MNTLKIIGIVVLVLIAIPLIVALFVPKKYTVEVTETINAPRQEVYDFIRTLRNQQQYSVWVMADPHLDPEIIGVDGQVGAIQRWNSTIKDVGEGEMEITALNTNRMDVDLRFMRPYKNEAKASYVFNEISPAQTELIAIFYSDSKYPMNLPAYFFGKKYIEDAQKENLKNVKNILER